MQYSLGNLLTKSASFARSYIIAIGGFAITLDGYVLSTKKRAGTSESDPDAENYINSVVAAGTSVSLSQKIAINNFVKLGKTEGWYPLIKRLYLPIWGAAAPNAIDMISLTSGTFIGGVTHASGYYQSNGSTGYFDTGVTMAGAGASISSASFGYLNTLLTHNATGQDGAWQSATQNTLMFYGNSSTMTFEIGAAANRLLVNGINTGIISSRVESGNVYISRRDAIGRTVLGTKANTGVSLANLNMYFSARNSAGSPSLFNPKKNGAMWIGLGLTDSEDAAFTLALKNLWENCTGLTIP